MIGNSDYDYAGVLRNPINDAQTIRSTLGELGFKVRTVVDADKRGMEQAIRSFGKQLRDRKGVGLFYYAGHGMQLDGENYLLPVNINPDTEDDVLYDGVPLGKLLAQMKSAGNGMNVVILDACRNNPFARSFRSTSRGLAQVVAPTGSFISYATAPGQVAADGSGENGLYTSKLLKHMVTPGVKLEDVFKRVRVDVQQESNMIFADINRCKYFASRIMGQPPEPVTGRRYTARQGRRIFPLKFVNVEFEVTEGGSMYAVQAIPFHEEALKDQMQTTRTDITFHGRTVAEMLQWGFQSLTNNMNEKLLEGEKVGNATKADQYIILFPI